MEIDIKQDNDLLRVVTSVTEEKYNVGRACNVIWDSHLVSVEK